MGERACRVCGNEAVGSVCSFCGTPQQLVRTLDEEREVLAEVHKAMAGALLAAKDSDPIPIRDRFLQNALVPSTEELLIDEAIRCQQWFSDSANMDAPMNRFEACVARLEVMAVDRPNLREKIKVLQRQSSTARARSRTFGLWVGGTLLLLIVAISAGVALAVMALRR